MDEARKKLLGERLRSARQRANLSQAAVSEALGVTRQSISAWENGASSPSAIQLAELAIVYCECAHRLLFGQPYSQVSLAAFSGGRKGGVVV